MAHVAVRAGIGDPGRRRRVLVLAARRRHPSAAWPVGTTSSVRWRVAPGAPSRTRPTYEEREDKRRQRAVASDVPQVAKQSTGARVEATMSELQAIVDSIATRAGRPALIEDRRQRVVVYS